MNRVSGRVDHFPEDTGGHLGVPAVATWCVNNVGRYSHAQGFSEVPDYQTMALGHVVINDQMDFSANSGLHDILQFCCCAFSNLIGYEYGGFISHNLQRCRSITHVLGLLSRRCDVMQDHKWICGTYN